jgi:hypothetical protein
LPSPLFHGGLQVALTSQRPPASAKISCFHMLLVEISGMELAMLGIGSVQTGKNFRSQEARA